VAGGRHDAHAVRPVLVGDVGVEAQAGIVAVAGVAVDDLVRDAMRFWGSVRMGSPSRSSFMKGYEVLFGLPGFFRVLRGAGKARYRCCQLGNKVLRLAKLGAADKHEPVCPSVASCVSISCDMH
jgi:hypothetical protein